MTLSEFVLHQALAWHKAKRPVALATIVAIHGSSSQPLGSRMAITDNDEFAGFVSGGCVESDVSDQAQKVIADGVPRRLRYRQVKDSVFEVGLNCDGQIEVVVERLDDSLVNLLSSSNLSARVLGYRRRDADVLEVAHSVIPGGEKTAESISAETRAAIESGLPVSVAGDEGWNYLIEPVVEPLCLLIVSASSVAYPLSKLAKALGYRVIVSDPRGAYLATDRFPEADLLLPVWPRELPDHIAFGPQCAVVSLNHEPRFEDDLFRTLQAQPPVGYIGAIGKRKRHDERVQRQKESGFDLSKLPPIHTPIGHDLGGKTAEEVALSIMAEVQASLNGRIGGSLSPVNVQ